MAKQQANALFHRKTLNKALRAFTFPADLAVRHQKIQPWIATLKTGTLNQVKEVSLHGDFLKDTFQVVLGYRSVIQGGDKSWELHAEQAISDRGGSADGALGFFTAVEGKKGKVKLQGRVVAPIELKGAKDDLDRPAPGRKESAVEQGWRYANYTPDCRWVIVSNYRELRLYQTSKTPAYYERFLLTELADIEAFKRFYFLLCRQNFLAKTPQELSAIDQLLAASNEAQEEITKQLYSDYKDVRLSLVKHFRFTGSKDIPDRDRILIENAQKTLDRLLFVAFCEDRGLLPSKTIAQAHDSKDFYNPKPIWDNYKAVFRWVDKGNDNPPIPEYNGGLFQPDPLLDELLTVPNPICSQLKQLTRFDFDTEVSVDILGRIFYEKGIKILKSGGVLSYIVTNKWLKSGYGEPLRQFFSKNSVFEQIIDFGHAPIFEDADTFPCIVAVQKPVNSVASETQEGVKPEPQSPVLVCPVPREKLSDINLTQYVQQKGYPVPWSRFMGKAWSLEPPAVDELMQKIKDVGLALKDFAGVKPYRGVLTGFNEAFFINSETRNRLINAEQKFDEIIKPYLRGQDIKRWVPDWQHLWMIFTRRGIDIDAYPAIKSYLRQYQKKLEPRPRDWDNKNGDWVGRKPGSYQWYEIQDSVDYWQLFEHPKIIWKDLSTYSEFCFDDTGIFTNDLCFVLASNNRWLLAVLNAHVMWYYLYRVTIHGANETLRLKNIYTETLPIASPTDEIRAEVEPIVSRLIEITKANQEAYRNVLDWLLIEQGIEKPGQKLEDFASLDADAFLQEVKKRKPKSANGLMPTALKAVRQAYSDYAPEIQSRKTEALTLEHRLSDLVNQAYGLTPEEIDLMWKTAPPRMPLRQPEKIPLNLLTKAPA